MCSSKKGESHVLVIDDEIGIRTSLKFALDSFCRVSTSASVREGLAVLEAEEVHTIILDLNLPGMSGIEGLREIRKLDKDVSVIILTAFGSLNTTMEAIRLGANDYQEKPFDVHHLIEVVCQHIDRTIELREAHKNEHRLPDPHANSLIRQTSQIIHAPLSALGMQLQLIRHNLNHYSDDPATLTEIVTKKFNGVNHSLRITVDMLNSWLAADTGNIPEFEPLKLIDVLRDVANLLQPLCMDHRIRFYIHNDYVDREVMGSRVLLLGAFYRLGRMMVSNMPPSHDLSINWRNGEDTLGFTFTGEIANVERPPFKREELQYVQSVLTEHKGRFDLNITPYGQAVVDIQLPTCQPLLVAT